MALIKWKEDFSVQVAEIDEQHKQFLKYLNDLNDAILAKRAQYEIGDILDGLIYYAVTHFDNEEKYFAKFAYEESVAHKQEHEIFTFLIMEQKNAFEYGDKTVPSEVLVILYNWFSEHIIKSDQRYTLCFLQNGLR